MRVFRVPIRLRSSAVTAALAALLLTGGAAAAHAGGDLAHSAAAHSVAVQPGAVQPGAAQPVSVAAPVTETSDGKTLTVSQAEDLPLTGAVITVTGEGYDETKGIYVAVCVDNGPGQQPTPCLGGVDMSGEAGASVWISSDPPDYAEGLTVPFGPGGSFEVELAVTAVDAATGTDCTQVTCVVATRADHTRTQDRSQDVLIPVTFSAEGSTGTEPAPSEDPSETGTSPTETTPTGTTPSEAVPSETTDPGTESSETEPPATSDPASETAASTEDTEGETGVESSAVSQSSPVDAPAAAPDDSSGSGWVWWLVGGILLVAVIVAVVVARRRNTPEAPATPGSAGTPGGPSA